jgi:hypothetical protein
MREEIDANFHQDCLDFFHRTITYGTIIMLSNTPCFAIRDYYVLIVSKKQVSKIF